MGGACAGIAAGGALDFGGVGAEDGNGDGVVEDAGRGVVELVGGSAHGDTEGGARRAAGCKEASSGAGCA